VNGAGFECDHCATRVVIPGDPFVDRPSLPESWIRVYGPSNGGESPPRMDEHDFCSITCLAEWSDARSPVGRVEATS
jgi:hypothetical protein